MSTTVTNTERVGRREDVECQAAAGEYLRALIGAAPDDLVWDAYHHLQGHAHCAGREVILIAARDLEHCPLVLTPQDWNGIRRTSGEERIELMRSCAISTHVRFMNMLFG